MDKVTIDGISYDVYQYQVDADGFADTIQAGIAGKRIGVIYFYLTSSSYATVAGFYSGLFGQQISHDIRLAPNTTYIMKPGKVMFYTNAGEELVIAPGINTVQGRVAYVIV